MAAMVAGCGGPLGAPPEISARPVTRPDGTVVQPSGPGSLFAESDMRPIGFSRVQTTIPRGAVIGETHYRPLTCEVGTSLHYDNDRRLLNPTAYSDIDRKSTRLNSSHSCASRMPSSACKKKIQ